LVRAWALCIPLFRFVRYSYTYTRVSGSEGKISLIKYFYSKCQISFVSLRYVPEKLLLQQFVKSFCSFLLLLLLLERLRNLLFWVVLYLSYSFRQQLRLCFPAWLTGNSLYLFLQISLNRWGYRNRRQIHFRVNMHDRQEQCCYVVRLISCANKKTVFLHFYLLCAVCFVFCVFYDVTSFSRQNNIIISSHHHFLSPLTHHQWLVTKHLTCFPKSSNHWVRWSYTTPY